MEFEFNYAELYENLDNLEHSLLEYEKQLSENNVDTTQIHIIFRYAHNLKGLLGIVEKKFSSQLIHEVETAFDSIRKGKNTANNLLIAKSLEVVDLIRENLKNDYENLSPVNDLKAVFKTIFEDVQEHKNEEIADFNEFELTTDEQLKLQNFLEKGYEIYLIEKLIKSDIDTDFFNEMPIYEDIAQIGSIIALSPKYEDISKDTNETVLKILFATQEPQDVIDFVVFDPYRKISLKNENTQNNTQVENTFSDKNIHVLLFSNDFKKRQELLQIFTQNATCHIVANETEIVPAFEKSINDKKHYDFFYVDYTKIDTIKKQLKYLRLFEEKNHIYGFNVCKIISEIPQKELIDECLLKNAGIFYLSRTITKYSFQEIIFCLKTLIEKQSYEELNERQSIDTLAVFSNEISQKYSFKELISPFLQALDKNTIKLEEQTDSNKFLNRIFNELVNILIFSQLLGLNIISQTLLLLLKNINQQFYTDTISDESIEIFYELIGLLGQEHENEQEVFTHFKQRVLAYATPESQIELFEDNLTDDKNVIDDFIAASADYLENLDHAMQQIQEKPESIIDILPIIHTLKADCEFVGLQKFGNYLHECETLLNNIQEQNIPINKTLIKTIADIVDFTKNTIDYFNRERQENTTKDDIENIIKTTQTYLETIKEDDFANITDPAEKAFIEQLEQYRFMLSESIAKIETNPEMLELVKRALESLLKICQYKSEKNIAEKAEQALKLIENNDLNNLPFLIGTIENDIKKYQQEAKEEEVQFFEMFEEKQTPAEIITKKTNGNELKTVRINEEKIDRFYNLVGELHIAKNTYNYLLNEKADRALLKSVYKPLKDNLHLITRLTNDLQNEVVSLRMLPLNRIFQKFTRIVHDISKQQDKKIDFQTYGADTELDKKVADMLSEPLVHLIRNACDHGIETPENRINNNKPEKGTVKLEAHKAGSELILKIKDDGAGMSKEKLKQKALKQNINLEAYNENNFFNIIFEPGFSTKEEISDISGRGVGMDVVKTTIDNLNGHISITSQEQEGTEITISVPISIGVNKSLLIETEKSQYAIPFEFIVETMKTPANKIKKLHQRLALYHRGEVIVTAFLSEILHQIKKQISRKNTQEYDVVILNTTKGKYAIIVDTIKKNMDLAVKQLPGELSLLDKYSGVSILGNGRVILVLNPEKLV